MFVSHEKNVIKKQFQKPNILRRKTEKRKEVAVSKPIVFSDTGSSETKSLFTSTYTHSPAASIKIEDIVKHEDGYNASDTSVEWKLNADNSNCGLEGIETSQETNIDVNPVNVVIACSDLHINNADKCFDQNSLNVDSFINSSASKQNVTLKNINATAAKPNKNNQTKWCLDLSNNMDIIINNYGDSQLEDTKQNQNFIIEVVPTIVSPNIQQNKLSQDEVSNTTKPTPAISVDCFSNRAVKFKCDEPNCTKGFWSEERLRKHKNSHKRQTTARPPNQIKIECPVKKVNDDGTEQKCEQSFLVRSDLLKHLNTDHTPEDAIHKCEVCGRRFFWASGLRAHSSSVCARGGLACAWPGCTRVFRLPCRLREHARAHTGDRPYLCRYPNCGWAFRSASKLVRHARRHTDERRHACDECERAFLRREHLRDHVARHHAPCRRPRHLCAYAGCEQTFTNMSTLYMHMKKVHRKNESNSVATTVAEATSTSEDVEENVYLVSVMPECESASVSPGVECIGGSGVLCGDAEWHAARTHCTWPLPRHAPNAALEEDVQVEQADGSSNVYTVRSDLFLHGNVPIDEDSQHMDATEISSEAAPLDTDLCLIDSHPTIDLMQEELMYDDTAVDESSFRVLLMNGEELT